MIIRVHRHERDFTILGNATLRDGSLSFRARGLLVFLLSLPPRSPIDSTQLAEDAPEGRDAIRRALRELEAAKYLHRAKVQTADGKWRTESFLFEGPIDSVPDLGAEDAFPGVGEPGAGKPGVGKPGVGKPGAKEKNSEKDSQERELRSLAVVDGICPVEGCSKLVHTGPHTNPWWDQLVDVFGYSPDGAEASLWGRLVLKARKAGDPSEIVVRVGVYMAIWPDAAVTPAALDKHFQWLGSQLAQSTSSDRQRFAADAERRIRRERLRGGKNDASRSLGGRS